VKRALGILALCATLFAFGSTAAKADMTLCNKTNGLLQIAIAHPITVPYETKQIRGWLQLKAGTCNTAIVGDLGVAYPLYYFIVQEDFTVYQPEGVPAEYTFCVTGDAFVRRGSWKKLQTDCPSGWVQRDFYLHTIPPGDFTLNIY